MNNSAINSSVSMQGLQQKLDIIAHNIANANTLGFKRKEATFHDILNTQMQQPKEFEQTGRMSPLGLRSGWGSKIGNVQIDMAQGSLQMTNNPLDVAIEGDALFEIRLSPEEIARNPNGGTVAWTKQGSFQFSTQPNDPDNVYLTTQDGQIVSGVDDGPIRIPKNHRIEIDAEGNILAYNEVVRETAPIRVGQIKVVHIVRPQLLETIGDKMFVLQEGVDNTAGQVLRPLAAIQTNRPTVALRQGFVEQSNVELTNEMSELILVQRAFQLNSRALSSADRMSEIANNLRG